MKLSEAIDLYIHRRRALGAYLHGPETILRSFLHRYGNLDLHRIRTSQITQFLNGRRGVRSSTWRGKYGALKLFLAYWCLRGRLRQSPVPLTAPKSPQDFIPYIYSRAELRRLLEALPQCQRRSACLITAVTVRALLLLLYGTGMRLGEALGLRVVDVDLAQNLIRIREAKFYKTRLVPIGDDVHRVLKNYLSSPNRKKRADSPLFQSKTRERIKAAIAERAFKRLRKMCGVRRPDTFSFQPRIHDLRHTFAVHRVTAWYRQGADVQKLLPALSTYLGHVSLESTQRYVTLTPELLRQANNRFERYATGGAR
jgi:site-specific recombinase XerD